MYNNLLTELSTSPLALCREGFPLLEMVREAAVKAATGAVAPPAAPAGADDFPLTRSEAGDVYLSLTGTLTKHDTWFAPGVDSVAAELQRCMEDPAVKRVLLVLNTPGGTSDSVYLMEQVLARRTKPVIALVDSLCASAGYYIACLCDEVHALHPQCRIGSIGVMSVLLDDREAYQQAGFRLIEIYPPESADKNRAVNEALDGDTRRYIDEVLSPAARHFQQVVREHRPTLDETVEGVLSGRVLYAEDALRAGLIDRIYYPKW